MIWSSSNQLFNDAFFLMLDPGVQQDLFPLWKSYSFKNSPVEDLLKAQEKLNEVIERTPDFNKAIFLKAIVQRQLNYTEESILYFLKAKENDLSLYACNIYLAEYYMHKLKFEEAQSYLDELLVIYPTNVRANFLSALIAIELFNFEKAKEKLNLLFQISPQKKLIQLLNQNLIITENIVNNTTNRLVLKNFKLKSVNYNLQLKTNLIRYFNQYKEVGISYDAVNYFIYSLLLKNITSYPNYQSKNGYNVHSILNYLRIDNDKINLLLDGIDFENHFVHSYEEYMEVELLMREEF